MTVPDEALKYILFQRTAYLRFPKTRVYRALKKVLPCPIYNQAVALEARFDSSRIKTLYEADMRKEYLGIKDFLPKTCHSVLDIGCGVAGIDVFLSRHYQDQQPVFYLLDKTEMNDLVFYGFKPKGAFYNSLYVAKTMLMRNGMPESRVRLVEATDDNEIDINCHVDLAISLLSWGFHYPLETYLKKVDDVLIGGGRVIIDIRNSTNGIDALNKVFGNVEVIGNGNKFQRVLAFKTPDCS